MKSVDYSIKKQYDGLFEDALEEVINALNEEGFGIITQINVNDVFKRKLNIDYPKYMILGACNPSSAFKALQAEKEIGLLLPCNVIIYEENKKIVVSVIKPTELLSASSNQELSKIANNIEARLEKALEKITVG